MMALALSWAALGIVVGGLIGFVVGSVASRDGDR